MHQTYKVSKKARSLRKRYRRKRSTEWLYQKMDVYNNKVIAKLPNSEQSYKGKVKTHKYINRQNQPTTGKLKT
jgi:hypothetical protein